MKYPSVAILGVPLDSRAISDIIKKCINCLTEKNTHTYYITVITTQLQIAVQGWKPSSIENPELLSILRNAHVAACSGKTSIRLARWLGSIIDQRIDETELIFMLIQELGKLKKGVFLLGSFDKLSKTALINLHENFPTLRIVGIATPPIYTEGEDLINASQRDVLLLEQIKASHADLLVVNLDSPKKELWFERVKHQLNIPLVIGISTPLKTIFSAVTPPLAPPHLMLKLGSWLKNLWRRDGEKKHLSFIDIFKIAWIATPLVIYHNLNLLFAKLLYANKPPHELLQNLLFLSPHRSLAVISLPPIIDAFNSVTIAHRLQEAEGHDVLILDFREVRHIQPEGFSLLIDLCHRRNCQKREFYCFCPSENIKILMQLHRVGDLLKNHMCSSAEMLLSYLGYNNHNVQFYDAIHQQPDLVVISLLGSLDNTIQYESYLQKLKPIIGQKDCVVDLSFCTYIGNRGFSFLLVLRKLIQQQGKNLTLSNVNKKLQQQFKTSKVDNLFTWVK